MNEEKMSVKKKGSGTADKNIENQTNTVWTGGGRKGNTAEPEGWVKEGF